MPYGCAEEKKEKDNLTKRKPSKPKHDSEYQEIQNKSQIGSLSKEKLDIRADPTLYSQVKSRNSISVLSKELKRIIPEAKSHAMNIEYRQMVLQPTNSLLSTSRRMSLRSVEHIKQGNDFVLPYFDPNFLSGEKISCRHAGCNKQKKRQSREKEDLYLCAIHREEMMNEVKEIFSKSGLNINYESYSKEDLEGYTSLIGIMEKGFLKFKKKALNGRQRDRFFAEIFLDIRNILIITNTVLNPSVENLLAVLPAVLTVLSEVADILASNNDPLLSPKELRNLVRYLLNIITGFFGIVYRIVESAVLVNPGAKIGAGLVGIVSFFAAGAMFGGPIGGVVGAGVGVLCGGLLGGGIFDVRQRSEFIRSRKGFYYKFESNRVGALYFSVEQELIRSN